MSRTGGGEKSTTLADVSECHFPELLQRYVDEYNTTTGDRSEYLWRWTYSVWDQLGLSSVQPLYEEVTQTLKTLCVLYVTITDDFAEAKNEKPSFEEVVKIPFDSQEANTAREEVNAEQIELAERIWNAIITELETAPHFGDLTDVFYYDIAQTINAMHHAFVMNQTPEMSNLIETQTYAPHNMTLLLGSTIDLAYSPEFKLCELGNIRSLVWETQKLARIGNDVTTWERELHEGDFSASIFVRALEDGVVTHAELKEARAAPSDDHLNDIAWRIRAHGSEEKLLDEWDRIYQQLRAQSCTITSFDVDAYLDGMETLLKYHLASRGKK